MKLRIFIINTIAILMIVSAAYSFGKRHGYAKGCFTAALELDGSRITSGVELAKWCENLYRDDK